MNKGFLPNFINCKLSIWTMYSTKFKVKFLIKKIILYGRLWFCLLFRDKLKSKEKIFLNINSELKFKSRFDFSSMLEHYMIRSLKKRCKESEIISQNPPLFVFTHLWTCLLIRLICELYNRSHIPIALTLTRLLCKKNVIKHTSKTNIRTLRLCVHFKYYASFYRRCQSFHSLFESLFSLVSIAVWIHFNRLQNTLGVV